MVYSQWAQDNSVDFVKNTRKHSETDVNGLLSV